MSVDGPQWDEHSLLWFLIKKENSEMIPRGWTTTRHPTRTDVLIVYTNMMY